MKYAIILALFGLMSTNAVSLDKQFRPDPKKQPWADKSVAPAGNAIAGAFTVYDDGSHYYEREVPAQFDVAPVHDAEPSDRLMWSLIKQYSLEGKGPEGKTGKFYLDKKGLMSISNEVVQTHLGLTGDKKAKLLDDRFPSLWEHFDVNKDGFLEIARCPQFLHMLIGEVTVNNGLQLQLDSSVGAEQKAHAHHKKHHHHHQY